MQESGDFVIIRLNQQLKINSPLPRSRFCHNQQLQIIIRANIKNKKIHFFSLFLLFPFLLSVCITILKQHSDKQTPGALKPSMVISVHKEGEISSLQSSFLWSHSQQTEMVEDITDDQSPGALLVAPSTPCKL